MTKNFKGLPMLRVLVFGTMITIMMAFAVIFFAGGALFYLAPNSNALNGTLNSQYQEIASNNVNPQGLFAGLSGLSTQLKSQGQNFTNPSLPTDLINTLNTAGAFFNTVPTFLGQIATYAGSALGFFGLPVGYFEAVGALMIIAIIVFAIIAIFSLVYS